MSRLIASFFNLILLLALLKMFAPGLANQTYELLTTLLSLSNEIVSNVSLDATNWTFE